MANSDGTPSALPVGHRLHEFEIVRIIGVGGFSIVYLALDHQLHRHVALKEYIPATLAVRAAEHRVAVASERERDTFQLGLRSFVNEARLLASFDHPSLLKVYRFWEQNDTAYMVMPYYSGPTLKAVLEAKAGPPDEAWLKQLLAPLLDALRTLHADRCYHRDISPDNILMLGPQATTPLLLDFGAARRVIGNASQVLTAILKPGFAPIEQYVETSVSARQGAWTDVYAVCAVLYTAIAGRIPVASVARLMDDELEPISDVARGRYSAAFLKAIDHGLAVRPEGRPQDIATLREELFAETVENDDTFETVRLPAPPPVLSEPVSLVAPAPAVAAPAPAPASAPALPRRPTAWRLAPWLGLVAIAAALAAGAWRMWSPSPQTAGAGGTQAAAVTPAPRGEFTVGGALDEIVRLADPTLTVVATAERDTVRIGRDDIRLMVKANAAGYLYVLFSGTAEPEIRLLYPNQRDSDHRIEANVEVTLPSPASKLRMTASGPPGVDRIVAIVSRAPRNFDGVGLRSESTAAFDLPKFDLTRSAQLWRAAAMPESAYAGVADCAASQPCPPGYGAALLEITEVAAGS
jgi:serine/threonine protein kinase